MVKKNFVLLREAVNTYKVNHCDGDKNEKELLEFIDELEQLTIPVVTKSFYCNDEKHYPNIGRCEKECDMCIEERIKHRV